MSSGYSSDLTDAEWALVYKVLNKRQGKQGRPPPPDARKLWDGIFYVSKNGCFWRDLPKDFGHWKRCYNYFSRLKHRGVIQAVMQEVHAQARQQKSRATSPSMGIVDSQSVKTRSFKKSSQGL